MKKLYLSIRRLVLFIMLVMLCACSTTTDMSLNSVLINDKEYSLSQSEKQRIEFTVNDKDSEMIICIPEGAVGYSWVPFTSDDQITCIKEEKVKRKIRTDIDGESSYIQKFTFQLSDDAEGSIILKKRFIDDEKKQIDDPTVHWYNELEIVIIK